MTKKKISRKQFLNTSGMGLVGLGLSGCILGDQAPKAPQAATEFEEGAYQWRMVTTWPPDFPILGEAANAFAEEVRRMSGGRIQIQVYGGGELVPPLEAFDAVRQGTAEVGCGASYYWSGKSKAAQFFAAVPFGMNAQQLTAWLIDGGGYELWKELYADFNLVPIPGGNTGVQMGGWFNKRIDTVEDLRGLKMRMPGLGGQVLEAAGGAAVLVAGGEVYTSLERGVIDATEWIGPYHDYKMGFHRIAQYYYYPGWHEPGSQLEFFINKRTFDALPEDLQAICLNAGYKLQAKVLAQFDAQNALYLQKIRDEGQVQILPFPEGVLSALRQKMEEVLQEMISGDPFCRKMYASYTDFQKRIAPWTAITEKAYLELILQAAD